jgi:hypothetical protein
MRAHLFNSITPTLRDWSGFFCLSVQFGGITASTWLASPKEETECFGREFFVCFLLLHLLHRGVYRIPRNSRRLERRAFAQSSDTSWTTLKRFLFPATVEHFFVSCSDFFCTIYILLYTLLSRDVGLVDTHTCSNNQRYIIVLLKLRSGVPYSWRSCNVTLLSPTFFTGEILRVVTLVVHRFWSNSV